MLWNFFSPLNFHCNSIIPVFIPSRIQLSESASHFSSKPEYPVQNREPTKIKFPLLNLTKEDLERADNHTEKRPWTEEEDEKLRSLREVQKLNWKNISAKFFSRNPKMCYNRYRRLENNAKNIWRKAQDEKIVSLVEEFGQNWKQIAKNFPDRSRQQIKERYINLLRPEINKDEWTMEEDLKLISLLNTYGKSWKYFQSKFDGRTHNQLKNRYFGKLKKLAKRKTKHDKTSECFNDNNVGNQE